MKMTQEHLEERQINSLAVIALSGARRFFADPRNRAAFEKWKEVRDERAAKEVWLYPPATGSEQPREP